MNLRRIISGVLLSFFVLPLFFSCEHDPIESGSVINTGADQNLIIEGVFRIKFSSESIDKVEFFNQAGKVASNSLPVNDAITKTKVKSIKRTFPPAGKFEPRSRAMGLHLWYDVEYDARQITIDAAQSNFEILKEIEATEVLPKVQRYGTKTHAIKIDMDAQLSFIEQENSLPFDDPLLAKQWHYYNDGSVKDGEEGCDINLFNAWLKTAGNSKVIVAVVDGGIDVEHEDLAENVWINIDEVNGSTNRDDDENGYVDDVYGFNFVTGKGRINAGDHGTHVAGTIGARNGNSKGVCGIAGGTPDAAGVRLMSCQVFDVDADGNEIGATSFAAAIKYGADNGAIISQNSWGYETLDYLPESMKAAIDYFIEFAGVDENGQQYGPMKGGVVIFAAGNDNTDTSYPAKYERVVSVASLAPDYSKAYYSNYGSWVSISAPGGTYPYSSKYSSETPVLSTLPNNQYGYMQGTSMACPHVSGVAALVASYYGETGFTNQMLTNRIYQGSVDLNSYNSRYINQLGTGLINSAGALANIESLPPEIVTNINISAVSNRVQLTWKVTSDPDDIKASGYLVYYSMNEQDLDDLATSKNGVDVKTVEVGTLNVGDDIGIEVDRLAFESIYYFKVIGYDILGSKSDPSATVSISTYKNYPPDIVTDTQFPISLKAHESKSIRLEVNDRDHHKFSWQYDDNYGHSNAVQSGSAVLITINAINALAGNYSVPFIAIDEFGAQSQLLVEYVIAENNPPILLQDLPEQYFGSKNSSNSISLEQFFYDEDEEPLAYQLAYDNSFLHCVINANMLIINAKAFGNSQVTVTATDARGEAVSSSFTVMVRDEHEPLDLYPNPVSDRLHIRMGQEVNGQISVSVQNVVGNLVLKNHYDITPFAPAIIDVSELPTGTYTIKIVYNEIEYNRQFVKV